ncbi:pyridine nucleotide-disulfide oxidoreductase/dicluster-binding protein [Clostridium sp. MT-14]|mgnify:CR=1 FL=1|uniref:pyridine nucleotide-disulfide oxidoreductase/dicluster-binding protein n=1 Tax=Clostridium sp. MT-14 TaxID=3348360 RepID=UPI0035F3AD3C
MDLVKLLNEGDRCIAGELPACTAICPIHVDIKSFIGEIENEDFKKAYKIISKKMPIPKIISRICDHPCEDACVRKTLGGSISISDMERYVVEFGSSSKRAGIHIPQKDKSAAVVGGGLSGIVVAQYLYKKGYQVSVYEKSGKIGGSIWEYAGKRLPEDIIKMEMKDVFENCVHVKLNTPVGGDGLKNIIEDYDAVYLGTGEWSEKLNVNQKTLQIGNTSVFAGGRLVTVNKSVIYSVGSAKTAALSIDRYLNNLSITASRKREGSYLTSLYVDVNNVKAQNVVKKSGDIYNSREIVKEAKRCLKCQCRKCVESCSHLQRYKLNSKDYIRQINHNETVVWGVRFADRMINSCALCGLCREICPVSIDMKTIIGKTRRSMVENSKMPLSDHDFALKDMKFSNGSRFFMAKKQPGYESVKYVFYPGCQLPASNPGYIEKIYSYLMKNIVEGVGIFLGCCGAPADWSGREDLMKEIVEKIKNVWTDMGKPIFILACPTCLSMFDKHMPFIKTISLWEVMSIKGVPLGNKIAGKKHVLNVHDACTARYNGKIQDSIRNIAEKLGYIIEELKYSKKNTKCCGYGGLVYFSNRDQSEDFIKDRIKEGDRDFLVYCAMCKDLFVSFGKRTYHILDLIYGDNLEDIALKRMPTLSERHENRQKVKMNLMKQVWGEDMVNTDDKYDFKLILTKNVRNKMEERLILLEDVKKVIANGEKKNENFFNPENSHYLARLRIENVTHWVEYEKTDEGVLVDKVYIHRMEVVEE